MKLNILCSSYAEKYCDDAGDCSSSETCCSYKCVKGTNCLGRECVIDKECLPQEKCCVDKCADRESSNPCLDPVYIILIVSGVVFFCFASTAIIVYVIADRRRNKRTQSQRRGQVLALPTQLPYQQFDNEESIDSETTAQETLPSVPSPYEMASHETNIDDKKHVESSLPTA
ncbi:hypothetical protein AC249_AIPGENE4277 [Exaiptasia diaphana]|nr:hypothetical protein AC249_AIPGENE4277 [Exaiptasia diaphana]